MTDLTPDTRTEVRTMLDQLGGARLPADTWDVVPSHLRQLDAGLDAADEHAVRRALVPLSRAVFEAKVRARLGPRRPHAAAVIPTKKTPALPIVGAICGGLLMLLGWQLGGTLVLAATAALALLVLGVAVAGTQANAERAGRRRQAVEPEDERIAPPAEVLAMIEDLRARPL